MVDAIPFTADMQKRLLRETAFSSIEVMNDDTNHGSGVISKARK